MRRRRRITLPGSNVYREAAVFFQGRRYLSPYRRYISKICPCALIVAHFPRKSEINGFMTRSSVMPHIDLTKTAAQIR